MPVAKTTALPVPALTDVPAKTRLGRSVSVSPSRSDASAVRRAGTDSPLSVERSTRSSFCFHQPRVGADVVAFGKQNHVARDEFFGQGS